ncbi:MAG TPA: hypothetical protein PLB95_09115 [Syntrophales bacterium]|nr:hypothetical protein [Syntrophales bacterium]
MRAVAIVRQSRSSGGQDDLPGAGAIRPGEMYEGEASCIPTYETVGAEIGSLVTLKQAAYGDSFGKAGEVLRIFYPNGISTEQYDDALCLTRIIDKLFRIATDRDALGEDPYRDIAGYCMLAIRRRMVEKAAKE